ncbi:MAG: hypothetical protein QM756_16345 [Polyangiaceae bacterium]
MHHPSWTSVAEAFSRRPVLVLVCAAMASCVGTGACFGTYLFFAVGILTHFAELVAPSDFATKMPLLISAAGYAVAGAGFGAMLGASAVPLVLVKMRKALGGTTERLA